MAKQVLYLNKEHVDNLMKEYLSYVETQVSEYIEKDFSNDSDAFLHINGAPRMYSFKQFIGIHNVRTRNLTLKKLEETEDPVEIVEIIDSYEDSTGYSLEDLTLYSGHPLTGLARTYVHEQIGHKPFPIDGKIKVECKF